MKKQVICEFEYRDGQAPDEVKVYRAPVTFPKTAPVAFHAVNQWGYHVYWEEKKALKARIEELEQIVSYLKAHIDEGANQVSFHALPTDDDEITLADLVKRAME